MPDTFVRPTAPDPDPDERPDPHFWGPERERPRRLARPAAGDGLLDRLRDLRADPRLGVLALVVVALGAGVVWYRMGVSGGANPTPAPAEAAPPPDAATSTTASSDGKVTVHVAGAVTRPGVIELPAGSRVIDAVEAVGGGLPEADLDRLNLAAPLVDGQRLLVQKFGDPPAPADPASGSVTGTDGEPTNQPINLNTATGEQLETLPGIGEVLAEAIITERDRRGGFRSVNELRDVDGIGDERFADLEGLVTV